MPIGALGRCCSSVARRRSRGRRLGAAAGAPRRRDAAAGDAPDAAADAIAADNEFLPEDRDLDDCVSALPQPGLRQRGPRRLAPVRSSSASSSSALAFIAWRIVRSVAPSRPAPERDP